MSDSTIHRRFDELRQLCEEIQCERTIEWLFPSGGLQISDYGRGMMGVVYYRPEHRTNDVALVIKSIDDFGITCFGKVTDEDALLKLIRDWERGLPDVNDLTEALRPLGLFPQVW